jgi:hypothetical protein
VPDGKLNLEILDVYGKPIGEKVDINLFNQGLAERLVLRSIDASKNIRITDLQSGPQGLYRIEIDAPSYLPVNRFVTIPSGKPGNLSVTCPIDHNKVIRLDPPPYDTLTAQAVRLLDASTDVLSFPGKRGEPLYSALDDLRKAGLLNILAKASRTRYPNGKSVVEHMRVINELRQDRFFVQVSQELRDDTKNSVAAGLFHPVPATLHSAPAGFTSAGSFKTEDRYGNLQLTFWQNGENFRADVDIDDAAGLEHVFQVLRNALTDRPTHPYDIHEILIAYQEIDPGYRLVVRDVKQKVSSVTG